jgi:CRP-like cAMP-binding protein
MRKVLYIFGQLRDEDIEWLGRMGRAQRYGRGTEIIRRGSKVSKLYIVVEGELEVLDGQGRLLARIGAGELAGEMSLIEARPPNTSVRTLGETTLFEIARDALTHKLETEPNFAARFYRAVSLFLSDRLRAANGARSGGSDDIDDELDLNVLDHVSQAGARFDRLVEHVHRRMLDA